jgi:hypothetical protein
MAPLDAGGLPLQEVSGVADEERVHVIGEDDGGHAVELGIEHVIGRTERDQGVRRGGTPQRGRLASRGIGQAAWGTTGLLRWAP